MDPRHPIAAIVADRGDQEAHPWECTTEVVVDHPGVVDMDAEEEEEATVEVVMAIAEVDTAEEVEVMAIEEEVGEADMIEVDGGNDMVLVVHMEVVGTIAVVVVVVVGGDECTEPSSGTSKASACRWPLLSCLQELDVGDAFRAIRLVYVLHEEIL